MKKENNVYTELLPVRKEARTTVILLTEVDKIFYSFASTITFIKQLSSDRRYIITFRLPERLLYFMKGSISLRVFSTLDNMVSSVKETVVLRLALESLWPNYLINSVDKTKQSFPFPYCMPSLITKKISVTFLAPIYLIKFQRCFKPDKCKIHHDFHSLMPLIRGCNANFLKPVWVGYRFVM